MRTLEQLYESPAVARPDPIDRVETQMMKVAQGIAENKLVELPIPVLNDKGGYERSAFMKMDSQFLFGMRVVYDSKERREKTELLGGEK